MIPKDWNNITIEQYVALKKTEAIECADKLAEHELRVQRACIITGLDPEQIGSWAYEDLLKVDALMNAELPQKVIKNFRIGGNYYRFKENPKKYDGDEYFSVMNACKDEGLHNIHRLCYLISQPVNILRLKLTVKPEDHEKRIEDFKQLPLSIANPMALFFYNLSGNLTNVILEYSSNQMKKATMEMEKEISFLDGTGIS